MELAPAREDTGRRATMRATTVLACGASVALCVVASTPVRLASTLAVLLWAGSALRRGGPRSTTGHAAVLGGLAVLAVGNGGVPDTADPVGSWMLTVSLAAYPLLAVAFFDQVGRYRRIRESDLVVECVLLGAAAAIVIQAVVESRIRVGEHPWGMTASSLIAAMAGLDVALVMVALRAWPVPAARRSPIITLGLAGMSLAVVHVSVALRMANGRETGPLGAAGAVAFGLFALSAVLDFVVRPPSRVALEASRFSVSHAVVVGFSIVATPAVVSIQVMTDISVSSTVAIAAASSAIVLSWHVITLLRERADSEHRATHDDLTDLPNRTLFLDRLDRAIAHASRHDLPVGVLYLDLDGFKDVNDTLGHDAGDRLLRTTSRRLLACAREEDTVARLAGDEFAILLPYLRSSEDVFRVAERVLEALSEPVSLVGQRVRSPGSVGVAVFPDDGSTPAELLTAADAAMYRAKAHGGGTVGVFSSELYRHAATRLEIENALHEGLERAEVVLHYQPIVSAADDRIVGAEALVRWQHPTRGLLSPADFIPVAEQSDLISVLGRQILVEACRELARWAVAGYGDRFISVNVSGRQFRHDLVSDVTAALRETGVEPECLALELTESAAVDDLDCVAKRLRELRALGVRAAIDDFGTGFCGLQYLGDLPVSTLKLDRSFVQAMTPSSAAITAATIAMAHSLGMQIVAEGVETPEQHRFLRAEGCDLLQGFHIGRPMPGDDLLDLLRQERAEGRVVPGRFRSAAGPEDGRTGSRTAPLGGARPR